MLWTQIYTTTKLAQGKYIEDKLKPCKLNLMAICKYDNLSALSWTRNHKYAEKSDNDYTVRKASMGFKMHRNRNSFKISTAS